MGILDDLLRVKKIREQRAEKSMLEAKRAYEFAQSAHQNAIDLLKKHQIFMKTEEDRLFSALFKKKSVKIEDIEAVRRTIADMAVEENKKKEEIKKKKEEEEAALSTLTEKKTAYSEAQQARSKFDELAEIYRQEEKARRQYKEEEELDELATLNYTPPEVM